MNQKRLTYNVKQAAEYTGFSDKHIYALLAAGKLEGFRLGTRRGMRVFCDSLEKFYQERINTEL